MQTNHSPNQRACEVWLVLPQFPHLHNRRPASHDQPRLGRVPHRGRGTTTATVQLPGQASTALPHNHSTGVWYGNWKRGIISEAKCSQNQVECTCSSGCQSTRAQGAPGHKEHRVTGSTGVQGAVLAACGVKDPRALKRSQGSHCILHPILKLCPPLSQEERDPLAPAPCPPLALALCASPEPLAGSLLGCPPATMASGSRPGCSELAQAKQGVQVGTRSTVALLLGLGGQHPTAEPCTPCRAQAPGRGRCVGGSPP